MVKERYKTTSIGDIPEDWEIAQLNEIGEITGGNTPKRSNDEYWGGDIPWLTPSQITENTINEISETDEYITEKGFENSSVKLLPSGTVMMSSRATIGECVINKVPMTTNQGFANVICDENRVHNYFLLYLLRHLTPRLEALAGGSTFLEISRTSVRSINIPLPPLPEQKKIADILSTVDENIAKTEEVIEKTKELKKGLMQQLLTKGIGHSEFKEVRIGPEVIDLPESWKVLSLSQITDVRSSNVNKKTNKNEKPVKLCNYLDVYNNDYIDNSIDFMEATAKDREIKRFTVERDDVIITKDSETPDDIGVPTVIIEDLSNVLCGYHLTLLKPNKDKIDGTFLSKILQSQNITNQFYRLAQGLTRFGLRVSSIENTKIPVPSLEEQKKIANILSTVDEKIQKEEEYEDKLEELKKGLMQKLLTGEVRVKVAN